jgi:hypothetical protein
MVRWLMRHRTGVTGVAAAVLAGVVGLSAVLAVQTQANAQMSASLKRETKANLDLAAANERERERFALAMDAVKLFHGEVSEDFLLKEKPFEALRTKLLRGRLDSTPSWRDCSRARPTGLHAWRWRGRMTNWRI